MVEHDGQVGQLLEEARRARHRRQHHRHVLDRQRRRDDDLAGRRHHAVPRREGDQLGRRLSRAVRSSAGPASIKPGTVVQRHLRARGHAPDARSRRPAMPDVVAKLHEGLRGRAARRSRCTSTATTCARSSRARRRSRRARSSSTGATTASSWRCATTTGSSSSPSSAATASTSGRSRSSTCACRSSTTCAPTRSSAASHESIGYPTVADRARLPARAGAGLRRRVARELQGVPAAPEAGELQPRPGDAEDLGAAAPAGEGSGLVQLRILEKLGSGHRERCGKAALRQLVQIDARRHHGGSAIRSRPCLGRPRKGCLARRIPSLAG